MLQCLVFLLSFYSSDFVIDEIMPKRKLCVQVDKCGGLSTSGDSCIVYHNNNNIRTNCLQSNEEPGLNLIT